MIDIEYETDECRSRTTSIINEQTIDYDVSPSVVVSPIINDDLETTNANIPLFSLRQVYKNLIIMCLAFTVLFTAYSNILSLQSSLNTKGNVGVNSLIVLNVFALVSSLFLTGISTDIFGLKWTMLIGKLIYMIYIIANIKPEPYIMYIAAALVGLVAPPLWTAQAHYTGCLARDYAHHKNKRADNMVSLFFGIFFAFFGTSGIWGNLISYYILNQQNNPQVNNCGVYFNPLAKVGTESTPDVTNLTRYILCGVFIGLSIIAVLLLLALDQIRLTESQHVKKSLKKSVEVIRSLFRWKHIDQLLLVPMTMWTMIESGFLTAQFTRAFITCLVGIRFVGLVLIFNGACHAIFSYVFGGLVKCIGRLGCFIIAALLNFGCLLLMYFWEPLGDQLYILFLISGLWGVAGAVWQAQVVAVYTVLYAETDSSAIAKYRLWKAVGSLSIYSYANFVTIKMTLIILFAFLSLSMVTYGFVEIHNRWKKRTKRIGYESIND